MFRIIYKIFISQFKNKQMFTKVKIGLIASAIAIFNLSATAQTKDIVETAVASTEHTTLVSLVTAAKLVDALKAKGPFTVFAPVNSAFAALDENAVKFFTTTDQGKEILGMILKNHVVAGSFDAAAVTELINKSKGKKATLTTLAGNKIYATIEDGKVIIKGGDGKASTVAVADIKASNGVIHAVSGMISEAWQQ